MEKLALLTPAFPRQIFPSSHSRGGILAAETNSIAAGSATTITFPLRSRPQQLIKRSLDLIIASILLFLMLPFFAVTVLLVRLSSSGSPFYGQKRVGLGGREFKAWKFRTMVADADARLQKYLEDRPECRREWRLTHKLKDDPRITSVGWFLRTTSLDELPQLWNVIVGQMSLVGPRPIIDSEEYDHEYILEHPEVFTMYKWVRPGITGLWQVSGRNMVGYSDRVRYDYQYLQNWSMWLDLYILLRTVKTVILREGAY